MKKNLLLRAVVLSLALASAAGLAPGRAPRRQSPSGQSWPITEAKISGRSIAIDVLVRSPADTDAELQVICLFESAPANTLHGSLLEMNDKLKGLLVAIRKPALFRGDLGETLLITPPSGTIPAKKLLIIGLGDAQSFAPSRMQLVGAIVYREAGRLGIAHTYFAPTVLDGGVTEFATGDVAEQVVSGFLRAWKTQAVLEGAESAKTSPVKQLTFLAGAKHASDTRSGIERAVSAASAAE